MEITKGQEDVLEYLANCNGGCAQVTMNDIGMVGWDALEGMKDRGWLEILEDIECVEKLLQLTAAGLWVLAKVRGTTDAFVEAVKELLS